MTIREELDLLGADAVRAGMVAFEHKSGASPCGLCCFLTHALGPGIINARWRLGVRDPEVNGAATESAFEGWVNGYAQSEEKRRAMREAFRQECIALLAEHGTAIERPVEAAVSP